MSKRIRRRARRRQQKRALIIGGIALVAVLAVFMIRYFSVKNAVDEVAKDKIWNHITIEGIDVSGMTEAEAKKALETKVSDYQAQKVTLIAEGTKTVVTLEELGLGIKNADAVVKEAVSYGKTGSVWKRYDMLKKLEKELKNYEVLYGIDISKAKTVISKEIQLSGDAAVNATIKRENGAFIIAEGRSGKKVDIAESVKVLEAHFNDAWKPKADESLTLVTVVDEPDIKKADLEKIKDVLGTYSTGFTRGSNRGKNITHAASKINGYVLMPGEEMSASDSMGSRNAENGYLEAGSYLNGTTVQTYGGGVCQVSSTLYNAILLAELEVTERWAHSMNVDYVEPSMDAAISEGYKDLKFKNNTDAPIYIEGITKGGKLTFTVYGKEYRSSTRKVSYVSETLSTTDPGKKFVSTKDPIGTYKKAVSAHMGIKAKLWKVVTENGVEVSREEFNKSSYKASPATYHVGIGSDNAEAVAIVKNAIATKNEAKIKAAIAEAQALISAATSGTPKPEEEAQQ